jgi:hypothetical protein
VPYGDEFSAKAKLHNLAVDFEWNEERIYDFEKKRTKRKWQRKDITFRIMRHPTKVETFQI